MACHDQSQHQRLLRLADMARGMGAPEEKELVQYVHTSIPTSYGQRAWTFSTGSRK